MAPMIAPISTSTTSQWPPSINISRQSRRAKLLLTSIVVITKAEPAERAGDDAVLDRDLAGAEMADQAGQHPGHDQLRDEGVDERQVRARLVSCIPPFFPASGPIAAIQALPSAMYQAAPASQATTAAITMAR